MEIVDMREIVTNAIKYWEPRRLVYNCVLGAIVLTYFALSFPTSKRSFSLDGALLLFIMAVLANVAYCAAYVVDLVAQLSGFAGMWRQYRWILLSIGIVFAGAITRFFAMGWFSNSSLAQH